METYFYHPLSLNQYLLIIGLVLSFIVELIYVFFYLNKLNQKSKVCVRNESIPVSIIICAKNQAYYLEKNLECYLNQDYPTFEIIVVDYGSDDNTEDLLIRLKSKYSQLRSTKIPIDEKFKHNKKLAITIGVKAAKYDQIILLNPNSFTDTNNWITNTITLANNSLYNAYSNFAFQKGFFYNFVRYDIIKQTIKQFAFTSSIKTYAGNAYNMSFLKSKFIENKGFSGNAHIETGYAYTISNNLTKTSKSVYSILPETKINIDSDNYKLIWKNINKHYFEGRKSFPFKRKLLFDIESITSILFTILLIYCAISTKLYLSLFIFFIIRFAIKAYCFKKALMHLREENLFLSSYVYVLIRPIYKLLFYIQSHIYSIR